MVKPSFFISRVVHFFKVFTKREQARAMNKQEWRIEVYKAMREGNLKRLKELRLLNINNQKSKDEQL